MYILYTWKVSRFYSYSESFITKYIYIYYNRGFLANAGGQQQSKMVSKISRSQDVIGISGFLWDFNLWISRFLWDLWDFYGIISVFYRNNRYFTEIIGINILLGISDLGFKQDFSSDFSICVQDFSLLRTPRANVNILARTVFSSYNCETFHVYGIQY